MYQNRDRIISKCRHPPARRLPPLRIAICKGSRAPTAVRGGMLAARARPNPFASTIGNARAVDSARGSTFAHTRCDATLACSATRGASARTVDARTYVWPARRTIFVCMACCAYVRAAPSCGAVARPPAQRWCKRPQSIVPRGLRVCGACSLRSIAGSLRSSAPKRTRPHRNYWRPRAR